VALTLRNENDTRPRLEYYPLNSPTLRTVVIEELPFVIGRGETAQLQIKSESISRAHAEIIRTASGYLIRDLNSTNGTALNGQPISESPLEDGDSISIAGTELSFACSRSGPIERMVTQALVTGRKSEPILASANEIHVLRELSEALLWQTIPLNVVSVLDSRSNSEQAAIISIDEPLASRLHAINAHDGSSTSSRIQQLAWQLAAEHASEITVSSSLFLRVELHSGLDERLFYALDQAFDCLSGNQSLGIVIPWTWATQSPETLGFCAELKELGAELAFDRFSGGPTCIEDMTEAAPDLLILAPTLCRGISSYERRMSLLKQIVSSCESANIKAVMPAKLPKEDCQAGNDIGLNLFLNSNFTPTDSFSSCALPISV
jgi:pSer/pThr/pTyr-binding forkhead associated (FHA) protein